MRLKIAQGRLYDPAHGWDGTERDLYIEGERIVDPLPEVDRVISAQGQAVLAGGIELRGHVAAYGLNSLRLWGLLPSAPELGETYASLGYTHVHEPFLTLYTANYVHRELAALPLVDTSASLVINLREWDTWLRSSEQLPEVARNFRYLLEQTRALNLRIMEPYVRYRQDYYAHRTIKIEKALEILATLAKEHNLTFALEASPEILRASLPAPEAFHLAALGQALDEDGLIEAALGLLEKGATADIGFFPPENHGRTVTVPIRVYLGFFQPVPLCPPHPGAAARRALRLALQYQESNLAFSGANAIQAPVKDYPRMFSWLWDRTARHQDWNDELPTRQYSLSEWAWATRTLPARILGLADRGHLGPGARADVALYDLPPRTRTSQWSRHLGCCRTLLKAGEIVIDNFSLVRAEIPKATYYRQTEVEAAPWLWDLCQYRGFRLENLWVQESMGGAWVGL